MTVPDEKVLAALRQYRDRSGYQLTVLTGLGAASLYPALLRLEQAGEVESRWYDEAGLSPRKRVYRVNQGERE